MAKKPKPGNVNPETPADEQTRQLTRIAKLLAMLVIKGEGQSDKIITMSAVGFTPSEISQLLGTTANNVAVTVYQHNKKKSKPGPRTRRSD